MVQAVDDVVTEPPRVGYSAIVLIAFGFGVPHDIEPMLCPPFAVPWAGEEPVDQPRIGAIRGVSLVRLDLFGSRRQPGEVERDAANPLGPARGSSKRPSLLLQPGQHKGVDRVLHTDGFLDGRDGWLPKRLKRPVPPRVLVPVPCPAGF